MEVLSDHPAAPVVLDAGGGTYFSLPGGHSVTGVRLVRNRKSQTRLSKGTEGMHSLL